MAPARDPLSDKKSNAPPPAFFSFRSRFESKEKPTGRRQHSGWASLRKKREGRFAGPDNLSCPSTKCTVPFRPECSPQDFQKTKCRVFIYRLFSFLLPTRNDADMPGLPRHIIRVWKRVAPIPIFFAGAPLPASRPVWPRAGQSGLLNPTVPASSNSLRQGISGPLLRSQDSIRDVEAGGALGKISGSRTF